MVYCTVFIIKLITSVNWVDKQLTCWSNYVPRLEKGIVLCAEKCIMPLVLDEFNVVCRDFIAIKDLLSPLINPNNVVRG